MWASYGYCDPVSWFQSGEDRLIRCYYVFQPQEVLYKDHKELQLFGCNEAPRISGTVPSINRVDQSIVSGDTASRSR